MNKVVIFANKTKKSVPQAAERIKDYLSSKNINSQEIELASNLSDHNIVCPDCDLAISLGGDGTVLTTSMLVCTKKIPIIAVSMGTFGYITNTDINEFFQVFEEFEKGLTTYQARMRLYVSVKRGGKNVFEQTGLNEVSIGAVYHLKLAKTELFVDSIHTANLRGDGIIVATPTGSTGYSLASGGPILDPENEGIIINPICPFTMGARPLIVSSKSEISIVIPSQNALLSLTVDGHSTFDLIEGDEVIVKRSRYDTLLVENRKRKFIEVLRDKLSWAGGFNA